MSFDEVTALKGKSGTEYVFSVVPRQTAFQARPGVYVLAKAIAPKRYSFCFVGETANLSVRPLNREKTACFDRFGADLIFLLEEFDANKRQQIVTDVLQAFQPVCNAQ